MIRQKTQLFKRSNVDVRVSNNIMKKDRISLTAMLCRPGPLSEFAHIHPFAPGVTHEINAAGC